LLAAPSRQWRREPSLTKEVVAFCASRCNKDRLFAGTVWRRGWHGGAEALVAPESSTPAPARSRKSGRWESAAATVVNVATATISIPQKMR
jgi:hypothetical protein